MKILLKIAYDGTNYNGWQSSTTGIGIEQIINDNLSKVLNQQIEIYGLSRTDSGVHALSNYATFDTDLKINPDKIYYAINDVLPKDISILESKEVPLDFNLRKEVCEKTYQYNIYNDKIRNPLFCHFAHHVYYNINIDKMIEASKYLLGTHCFKSFTNPDCQKFEGKTIEEKEFLSIKTIYEINITKNDNLISIYITGDNFLYNMVRIICGTLLKIGMNMWEPSYIKTILEKKDRKYAGFTLPSCGLILYDVKFKKNF